MKKIFTFLLIALAISSVSFAKESTKKKAEKFTFKDYNPKSADVFKIEDKKKIIGTSRITYPLFLANGTVDDTINKKIKDMTDKFKSNNKSFDVTHKVTGSNDKFVSVLFEISEKDTKKHTVNSYHKAITFDAKTGKELKIKDLLVNGFDSPLEDAIKDKSKQLGLTIDSKSKLVDANLQFYLDDDGIVFFYKPNSITKFGDGEMFIPFIFPELNGILVVQ